MARVGISEQEMAWLPQAEVTSMFEKRIAQLVLAIRAKIAAEDLTPRTFVDSATFEVPIPLTWWDHFKHQHPKLTRRLKKPRYQTIMHTAKMCIVVNPSLLFPSVAIPPGQTYYRHIEWSEPYTEVIT